MTRAYPANYKAMERVMQHMLNSPDHRVIMLPDTDWDRNKTFHLLWMVYLIQGMQLSQSHDDAVGVCRFS